MAQMAILQEVDKCIRCNGCVISCKRTWKMKALDPGVHKVAADSRVMIKSMKRVDMGPFLRFSCWHCPDPPCAKRCPFGAIVKNAATGAVEVNHTKCNPNAVECTQQCVTDCQRGGYPKIGAGSDMPMKGKIGNSPVMQKCTMCSDKINAVTGEEDWEAGVARITTLPGLRSGVTDSTQAHEPSCVYTCPAKAMIYDTRDAIIARIQAKATAYRAATGKEPTYYGDGSMFWYSEQTRLSPPKADPFVEDHMAPMASALLSSPLAKAAIVPTLVVGGLLAVSARRSANETSNPNLGEA